MLQELPHRHRLLPLQRLAVLEFRFRGSNAVHDDKVGFGLGQVRSFETLGLGDDNVIPIVDAVGVTLAGVKSLSKKVKKLEGLGLTVEKEGLGLTADDGGGVPLDLMASPRLSLGLGLAVNNNSLGLRAASDDLDLAA